METYTQTIELIAAVSRNNVIGLAEGAGSGSAALPWHIPEDLAHFRQLTLGHNVLMGYNTWKSLPAGAKPLTGRINIVISNGEHEPVDPGVVVVYDIKDIPEVIRKYGSDRKTFIIGGAKTYDLFNTTSWLPRPSKLHITHIDTVIKEEPGTVFFHHPPNYKITSCWPTATLSTRGSEKHWSETEKCHYQYITYEPVKHDIFRPVKECADIVYKELLEDIMRSGTRRQDRTGTGTISVFGRQLRFNLDGVIPLLTTKYVPWKSVIKELLWFLKGQTDASILKSQGVGIWDGNTSREFLDGRGLGHLPEGDIGAGYGFQWRHFNGEYKTCKDTYDSTIGYDQVAEVLRQLREDPLSRRIYMTAWNPAALGSMALPPCHVSAQFYVDVDDAGVRHLSCHMYQRSVDVFLGLPFNIMSYATLTYIFAAMCGMKPRELVISTGDTHIYRDHMGQVMTQLGRQPCLEPVLVIHPDVASKTVDELTIDDFDVVGYFHHGTLKGKMSV
jgi:thymidylate synthase/dihydrofolate reductase